MGQGRTLEGAKDNRRLSTSARTTRKPPRSYRAQRGASDRGMKPIQKDKVRSTNKNRRSRISGNLPTHWPIWWPKPQGGVTTWRNSPTGKRKHTKPSFRSRTNKPRPHRGDPIAKGVNHMGEENPQEPGKLEQAGELRRGKKSRSP